MQLRQLKKKKGHLSRPEVRVFCDAVAIACGREHSGRRIYCAHGGQSARAHALGKDCLRCGIRRVRADVGVQLEAVVLRRGDEKGKRNCGRPELTKQTLPLVLAGVLASVFVLLCW